MGDGRKLKKEESIKINMAMGEKQGKEKAAEHTSSKTRTPQRHR
jgi:hypothetical protein